MMVTIWIDNARVQVVEGRSILAAARELGIDISAMCCQDGRPPNTSCMCCLVRVDGSRGVVPACATQVREGMRVESETAEIQELRRTGIELLLADHASDCHAPCENTCPARMDVPNVLRHVAAGDYRTAIETVKRDIALPAILGRVCPEVWAGLPPRTARQSRRCLQAETVCGRSGFGGNPASKPRLAAYVLTPRRG